MIAKLWNTEINSKGIRMQVKKGGSSINQTLPFVRSEIKFNRDLEILKLTKIVSINLDFDYNIYILQIYDAENKLKVDKNLRNCEFIPLSKKI